MQKKLKIFTDLTFLPKQKNITIMLYPFFSPPKEDDTDPDYGRFDIYIKEGNIIFTIVENPQDADVLILPFEYSFEKELHSLTKDFIKKYEYCNKKTIVFFNSDNDQQILLENVIIFRTSFYKYSQKPYEFAVPGWSVDFIKYIPKNEETNTSKPLIPRISYCGYIDYPNPTFKYIFNNFLLSLNLKKETIDNIGPRLRGKAVRKLIKSKKVKCNFIIRNGFWAPGLDKIAARKEYVENMLSSDYALVVRGAGNFSYRLYEVLSCGKIPVFIYTDCVLPFDTFIDWKQHVVWVNDADNLVNVLANFHENLTEEEFNELKRRNRQLYEQFISPNGFFSNLYKYFK